MLLSHVSKGTKTESKQRQTNGIFGPLGRRLSLCFDRVMVALVMSGRPPLLFLMQRLDIFTMFKNYWECILVFKLNYLRLLLSHSLPLSPSFPLQDIIATLGVRLGPALKLIAAAMIVKSKSPQPRSKN